MSNKSKLTRLNKEFSGDVSVRNKRDNRLLSSDSKHTADFNWEDRIRARHEPLFPRGGTTASNVSEARTLSFRDHCLILPESGSNPAKGFYHFDSSIPELLRASSHLIWDSVITLGPGGSSVAGAAALFLILTKVVALFQVVEVIYVGFPELEGVLQTTLAVFNAEYGHVYSILMQLNTMPAEYTTAAEVKKHMGMRLNSMLVAMNNLTQGLCF